MARMEEVDLNENYISKMEKLQAKLNTQVNFETTAEVALQKLKLSNLEQLVAKREAAQKKQEENIQRIHKLGLITTQAEKKEKEKQIEDEYREKARALNRQLAKEQQERIKLETSSDMSAEKKAAVIKQIKEEIAEKRKGEKQLLADKAKQEKDGLDKKLKDGLKLNKKLAQDQAKQTAHENGKALSEGILGSGKTVAERKEALKSAFTDENGNKDLSKGFSAMTAALSDLSKQLNSQIEEIAGMKTAIDTRLQGSTQNKKRTGSYWDQISNDFVGVAGVSPYVKQSDLTNKVKEMVSQGISYNVEQRAFLATISDKIATTFNAADGTLLRLIRIQQQDSTAYRLGMESAMTSFLNNMYETTEYLNGIAENVRSSLGEAQALMGTNQALEFEYQVQKWLGSLYSVGMSQDAINKLSNAVGKLAAGDISGLTGDSVGNLMIMAANNSGLSIAEILADGLDASSTNKLMQSMVTYLAGIYDESQNSKVIQQQFANVYGLTASDLKAATNLIDQNNTTIKAITNNNLTTETAMTQLTNMASTMYQRVSMGQMMTNAWDNLKYTMSAGIANSPVLYATYKIASLLDDTVGGIALPDIKVMGTGVNLQTSVADLMRVGALSGSVLKGLGQMITSGSGGGISGSGMLSALGIGSSNASVHRGTGDRLTTSGVQVSSSGYVGNSSSGDVYDKTMTDANDNTKGQLAEAKESEDTDVTNKVIDTHVVDIYNLIKDVTTGTSTLKVDMGNENAWTSVIRAGNILNI